MCLLSMSWSCREQCTGKTAHYGRWERGKWRKGGSEGGSEGGREIFDEAPGVRLMRSNVRKLLLSSTANGAAPHCYNQPKK